MNPNYHRRATALGVSLLALVGGGGCATALTMSGSKGTTITKPGDLVLDDTIVALGRPDAAFAKQINNPRAIAFFGKANTYLLVTGGERLLGFAQDLDSKKIALIKDSGMLFLKDKTVWGSLKFTYTAPSISADEEARLRKAGFTKTANADVYAATVYIQGAVYPAMSLGSQTSGSLHQARELSFRSAPTTETKPDLSKIITLPLAVVVDIVTAPLQLLGFLVFMVGMGASK